MATKRRLCFRDIHTIHVLLVAVFFFFLCKLSSQCLHCQTLFPVLCLCPYFTAWVQCAGHIVWGKSFTHISRKIQNRKEEEKYKLWRSIAIQDGTALGTATGTNKVKWMTWRYSEGVQCDMLCYDGLMACVGSGEVNITKLLQKVPDGGFQSGSEWGNMPYSDRVILIDGFSYFKKELQLHPFTLFKVS